MSYYYYNEEEKNSQEQEQEEEIQAEQEEQDPCKRIEFLNEKYKRKRHLENNLQNQIEDEPYLKRRNVYVPELKHEIRPLNMYHLSMCGIGLSSKGTDNIIK